MKSKEQEDLGMKKQIEDSLSAGTFGHRGNNTDEFVWLDAKERMNLTWDKLNRYEVHELEEILDKIATDTAVTRSHLGFHVLNTPNLTVFDIDFDPRWGSYCHGVARV